MFEANAALNTIYEGLRHVAADKDSRPVHGFLKVSSRSFPASVAGAIAGLVKDGSPIELQAVGAGAVNQAIKAIAISRGFLAPDGYEVVCVPNFADIVIDGQYRTAIRIHVIALQISKESLGTFSADQKARIIHQSEQISASHEENHPHTGQSA